METLRILFKKESQIRLVFGFGFLFLANTKIMDRNLPVNHIQLQRNNVKRYHILLMQ